MRLVELASIAAQDINADVNYKRFDRYFSGCIGTCASCVATFLWRLSPLPTLEATPTTNLTKLDIILTLIWPLCGGSLALFVFEGLAFSIDRAICFRICGGIQ